MQCIPRLRSPAMYCIIVSPCFWFRFWNRERSAITRGLGFKCLLRWSISSSNDFVDAFSRADIVFSNAEVFGPFKLSIGLVPFCCKPFRSLNSIVKGVLHSPPKFQRHRRKFQCYRLQRSPSWCVRVRSLLCSGTTMS